MTLKIESVSDLSGTVIKLIGRMQAEHLEELEGEIQKAGPVFSLDMEELSLVDIAAVRFLAACQKKGIRLLHCTAYIRDWINKELQAVQ